MITLYIVMAIWIGWRIYKAWFEHREGIEVKPEPEANPHMKIYDRQPGAIPRENLRKKYVDGLEQEMKFIHGTDKPGAK